MTTSPEEKQKRRSTDFITEAEAENIAGRIWWRNFAFLGVVIALIAAIAVPSMNWGYSGDQKRIDQRLAFISTQMEVLGVGMDKVLLLGNRMTIVEYRLDDIKTNITRIEKARMGKPSVTAQ